METALNTIIDRARQSRTMGQLKFNPYPAGSLRHLAYEIGFDHGATGVIAMRSDGQVFAVQEIDVGEYQSVVPSELADQGLSKCHTSLEDAVDYVRELAGGTTPLATAA